MLQKKKLKKYMKKNGFNIGFRNLFKIGYYKIIIKNIFHKSQLKDGELLEK